VSWNLNGTWLASCSRDMTLKVWDVRHTKRELVSWQGHQYVPSGIKEHKTNDISCLAWHPVHLELLATGMCAVEGGCVLLKHVSVPLKTTPAFLDTACHSDSATDLSCVLALSQ
jgi:WD40 repeat protein